MPFDEIISEKGLFVASVEIFDGQDAEILAGFGFAYSHGGDDAGNGDFSTLEVFNALVQFLYGGADQLHFQLVRVERMRGQVNTD